MIMKPALLFMSLLLLTAASALAGPFVGINYGPFHESGQQPGTPIADSQITSDLNIMSQKFTYIKTYGDDSASNLDRVVPIAAGSFPQLKIYQGVFENSTYNRHKTGQRLPEDGGRCGGRQRMPEYG